MKEKADQSERRQAMSVKSREILDELPEDERQAVAARAQQLIAEETSRQRTQAVQTPRS